MIAPYFPSILVPIVGIFLPGIAMATLFIYIEKESVEWKFNTFFLLSIPIIYNDDPKPEYDPYKKTASTLNTATPPTSAISQRGIRLFVSAINKVLIINKIIKFNSS